MIAIGIDPGVNGGIVALRDDGSIIFAEKMPETDRGILDLLRRIDDRHGAEPVRAVLENVHSMPKQGIVSAFTFGQGFGGLRMALAACEIPYDLVVPRKWQPLVGVLYPKRAVGESRDKNVSKVRAQQLFPSIKVTHAIADALLIAEACRRWHSTNVV